MTDKSCQEKLDRWEKHARFLAELAGHAAWLVKAEGAERADAIEDYTRWLSEQCFRHAEKHMRDDFKKNADEPISTSGDRVKKDLRNMEENLDDVKRYYGEDGWKSAMKEYHGSTINKKEKDGVS